MSRAFLVLHGYTNRRPEGHWQRRLVTTLRSEGELVVYPALPDTDDPHLEPWVEAVQTEVDLLAHADEVVVVGHSLGAVTWLHVAGRGLPRPVGRVLLVAPPGPSRTAEDLPRFVLDRLDPEAVRAAARSTLLVGSDADPWCPEGIAAYAEPLGVRHVLVPGAAHFALDDGFGPWPEPIAWCRDPGSVWT
ncbi:MAG TPA: alpha/beta fold hydrolase [Candidatus Nanopelagicales bacterium]|nr:alpha/beta fold hydrolase [Candidatus Nanopelagicales bacterium]